MGSFSTNQIIMFVAIAIIAVVAIYLSVKKRTTFNRLQDMLSKGEYDAFFELIDKPLTRALYPAYNLTYFKLNAYILKGDDQAANDLFDQLLASKTSKTQRYDLVVKAFNFYVGQEDKKRSKAMLKEIESWEGEQFEQAQTDCRTTYDIVISKKSSYIDEMEAKLEQTSGAMRGRLEYLLAIQYENQGDKAKAEEYLQRSRSSLSA